MAKKLTVANLKKELKNRSQEELIEMIANVYKKSDVAMEILNFEIQGREYMTEQLLENKKKLDTIFSPFHTSERPIAKAKKVISEFDRNCSDQEMRLDLKIHFVECALDSLKIWKYLREPYYNSVCSMFEKVVNLLNKLDSEEMFKTYEKRLRKIVAKSDMYGGTFAEDMSAIFYDIQWIAENTMETEK